MEFSVILIVSGIIEIFLAYDNRMEKTIVANTTADMMAKSPMVRVWFMDGIPITIGVSIAAGISRIVKERRMVFRRNSE